MSIQLLPASVSQFENLTWTEGDRVPRPPRNFAGFFGQPVAVHFVQKLVDGARQKGKPLPSMLLHGPSGFGKTFLAEAIASAFGTKYHYVLADSKMRPADIYLALRDLSFGDILCLDEAHRLSRDSQVTLYRALDERLIPAQGLDDQGHGQEESIAEFCLILATNFPGDLQKALRNRTTQITFDPYTKRELVEIGRSIGAKLRLRITAQALGLLADASQGSPRSVRLRLENLELFAPDVTEYSIDHVRDLLKAEGFDSHNLSPLQRAYLRCPAAVPTQRATVEQLAVKLGIDARFIRQEIEPYLIEQGYVVVRSNNTRELTDRGQELLREPESQDCAL